MNDKKKRGLGLLMVIFGSICLVSLAFAIGYILMRVNDNYFQTGEVKINLNNGNAVINEEEFLFEPGMTVNKSFFIQNQSSCNVYYRIYFKDVKGDLGKIIEVTIKDGDTVLYSDRMGDMNKLNALFGKAAGELEVNERKDLVITFHYPEQEGNEGQGLKAEFTMCADAVQVRNNTNKEFE